MGLCIFLFPALLHIDYQGTNLRRSIQDSMDLSFLLGPGIASFKIWSVVNMCEG